ncbi:MAG TPA: hypothetical protein ENK57_24925, partial [Polyangiaceae bacterium]|nr:hypothetical protein [Polyangiaceae bacterium]
MFRQQTGGPMRYCVGMRFVPLFLILGSLVPLTGCDCKGPEPAPACATDSECGADQRCQDGMCIANPRTDAGPGGDAGEPTDAGPAAVDAGCPATTVECGRQCCSDGEICRFDSCVSDLGPCDTSDDCWGDSYCVDGRCVPYGVPADHTHDEMCTRSIDIEAIVPQVQCRWTGPPEGDARPGEIQVMATPVVVDLDLDADPATLAPSIVFASFPTAGSYRQPGVLRVIDGRSCTQQFSFPDAADAVMSPASVAAADLDGDGRAEIIAVGHSGGLKAFGYDAAAGTFARLWTSGVCDAAGGRVADNTGGPDEWAGPSAH